MKRYRIQFARLPVACHIWGLDEIEAIERARAAYASQMGYTRADLGDVSSIEEDAA